MFDGSSMMFPCFPMVFPMVFARHFNVNQRHRQGADQRVGELRGRHFAAVLAADQVLEPGERFLG